MSNVIGGFLEWLVDGQISKTVDAVVAKINADPAVEHFTPAQTAALISGLELGLRAAVETYEISQPKPSK